ncbi:MAG: GGDEF domain-containing protein, partial [Gammaproteobacteria bacterium]|nr:GGDEF domain-containing protein [Gammaproteobacteria bacterium]
MADEFTIENLDRPLPIAGAWRFQIGDNMAWADPGYDDLGWPSVLVPRDLRVQGYEDYTGMAWYRFSLKFDLDNEQLRPDLDHLGITLGKIHSAYELYAGGVLLGGVGKLPPNPEMVYDRYHTFPIPRAALDEEGRVNLAVRVWRHQLRYGKSSAGAFEGPFLVGTVFDLTSAKGFDQLSLLVLSSLYLVFGIYHLYLYRRNPQLRQYLWFGLLTVGFGLYAFLVSQWKHFLEVPFLLLKKIEYGVLYTMPAVGMEMIWSLLGFRPQRWARLYQLSFPVLAAVAVLVPGYSILFLTLTPWQVWALPGMLAVLVQIIWYSQGYPSPARTEARTVLIGTVIFVLTAMNDILVEQGLLEMPRLVPLGFAAVLISMAVSLANRFTLMFSNLEARVNERTQELIEANVRLREAARGDVLTGLLNRRGFSERADEEMVRARRNRCGFVLVMADIDRFKAFNDKFGHACGDFVLEQVAGLLREQLRDVDVIARWGGEEFILLLPETSLQGGAVVAEKLRASVATHRFEYEDRELHLTLTFGVAEFYGEMEFDDCLALADRALYCGKTAGRNVVEVERER